jgi:hypothetical protein
MQTSDWGEVSSKIVSLVEIFPMNCGTPPARKKIKEILDF